MLDPVLNLVDILVVKRTLPDQQLKQENSDGPPVYIPIILSTLEHLRRLILRRSHERFRQLPLRQGARHTEIDKFYVAIL